MSEPTRTHINDKWIKCIAIGGNIMATSISAAELVEDARQRHKLGSTETRALGEALMAGLLLASTCKSGERVSLSVKGEKFFRHAMVDATRRAPCAASLFQKSSKKTSTLT